MRAKKTHVIEAIKGTGGVMSKIAEKIGCSWHTARKYIETYNLSKELEEEQESVLDLCESKLIENIEDNDNQAIFYYLNNRGKSRGYNRPQEIKQEIEIKRTVIKWGDEEIEV